MRVSGAGRLGAVLSWCGVGLLAAAPLAEAHATRPSPWQRAQSASCQRRAAASGEVRGTGAPTTIGITYFAGRSRRGDDAHLAAALTAELASQLRAARLRGSTEGSSARSGAPLAVRLSDAGASSDVDLSLTGSVFRQGAELRSNVRVTRTTDGTLVWAGTRSRTITDLPQLARLIAQEVVTRINAQLPPAPPRAATQASPRAYELLLQGIYLTSRYGPDDLDRAILYVDSALALDAALQQAIDLRRTAELRLLAWGGDGGPRESRLVAAGSLRRILERKGDASELLVERADLEMRRSRIASACEMLNRAIELDSRATPAYALRSLLRARGGNIREAFGDAETVTQLGRPLWGDALRSIATTRSGDTTSGRKQSQRLLERTRSRRGAVPFWDARLIASALSEAGLPGDATALVSRIDARDPRLAWIRDDPSFRNPYKRPASRRSTR